MAQATGPVAINVTSHGGTIPDGLVTTASHNGRFCQQAAIAARVDERSGLVDSFRKAARPHLGIKNLPLSVLDGSDLTD